MMPLCISSAPILGPTDSVPRSSYLSPIVSSTSLIATCWHHSARWSGVMSMLRDVGVAARQLALLDGEADAAHRIAPVRGVERAGRRELDVAGPGRTGLDAPAVAGAALHDALGVGDALGVAFLALDADQGRAGVAEFLQRDLADAQAAQGRAQLVEMDRALLGAHLDGDAALEVDAEVEAEHEDADQRQPR